MTSTQDEPITFPRTFCVAPLLPSNPQGDLSRAEPGCYLVGEYGREALTLAEVLPANVEFALAEAKNAPQWARDAYDDINTIVGPCSGLVFYRAPGTSDIQARAFAEMCDQEIVGYRNNFDTARYLDQASPAHHNLARNWQHDPNTDGLILVPVL